MSPAADLAHRLARDAEAVCRYYLPHGRREGRYWLVGDVNDTPGRSLFVRLHGPEHGRGAAGRWTDAQSGQYGDLLDLIALNRRLDRFRDVLAEARAFLSLPRPVPVSSPRPPVPCGSPEAARRLFAMARPLSGTLAEAYLRGRGITALPGVSALRFHPGCYYRPHDDAPVETWPALIAAVTDLAGTMTGAHRTWLDPRLDPAGGGKAPIATPRRAMGHLLGNAVRFGVAADVAIDVMAAGEGIETMLSLRTILPALPMVAALSANHLAAILLPATLRRLYVARDHDAAGDIALARLAARARDAGIEPHALSPMHGDFNDDLRRLGSDRLRAALLRQLAPEDVARFMGG